MPLAAAERPITQEAVPNDALPDPPPAGDAVPETSRGDASNRKGPAIDPSAMGSIKTGDALLEGRPAGQAERSLELAMAAALVAADNRGTDVRVLDMRRLTPAFDYFVVATGNSRRQLHAISEEIDHRLEDDLGEARMGIEGYAESRWILLDYGSIVIHLFDGETRDFYDLENLWVDAVPIPLPWDSADEG